VFSQAFVEEAQEEIAVEGLELVLALEGADAAEAVAEVVGVAVEEVLFLDKVDEH
jgi:hypothetical protein